MNYFKLRRNSFSEKVAQKQQLFHETNETG